MESTFFTIVKYNFYLCKACFPSVESAFSTKKLCGIFQWNFIFHQQMNFIFTFLVLNLFINVFKSQKCLHSHSKKKQKKPNSAILLQDKSNFALLLLSPKMLSFELMLAILCLERKRERRRMEAQPHVVLHPYLRCSYFVEERNGQQHTQQKLG